MYQGALSTAHIRISNAWEADTIARRDKTMQELNLWLSQLPAMWHKTLMSCTPADIIAFMENSWLLAHAGTRLENGSLICSPSGVNQCFSSMSKGFGLIGRVASWTPEAPSGNPIQSSLITSYRKGYRMQAWRLGYLEGSAVPISEHKVFQLVDHIDSLLSPNLPAIMRVTLERDIMLVLLMWETSMKGNNCGRVTLSDFCHPGGNVLRAPLPGPLPVGYTMTLRPNGTKTIKGHRSGPFTLTVDSDYPHSYLARLPMYLQHRFPEGAPPSAFLFSPLTTNQLAFKHTSLSASAIGKRVKHHLEQAVLYAGESSHGFKRGHMQFLSAAGMNNADIGQKVQIKTAAIIDRYLDPARHLPRLDRMAQSSNTSSSKQGMP